MLFCIRAVKETNSVELLPAERNILIEQRKGALTERMAQVHDGVIVLCARGASLDMLPFGSLLDKEHRNANRRGPVSLLSTRVGATAIPFVVVFLKENASAFDQLSAGAKAWKELAPHAPTTVLFAAHGMESAAATPALEALVAAALAGSAPMPVFKTKPPAPSPLESITLAGGATIDSERALAVDRGNHLTRWLTTLPPNILSSTSYRRALMTLAKRHGWGFQFYDEATLKRLGAGAFLAVARANAHRDAGIVRLRYRAPDRKAVAGRLALVGKGICFDTGGINLKPHKSMYHMHEDMQGSAVATGTLLTLSELEAPYDIDCWVAITENEIGARAYRPQEVVKASNGVTIQVVHSDAEGRMALADTLALASREKPELVIDYATLTGACVMALSDRFSGAFTNRPAWHTAIELAGRHSGERVWPFPMDEDYDSDLDSQVADILQCTMDSKGDHILAARFLSRFVPEEIPWIHLDLAASNRSGGLAHIPTDFTGFGVRFTTSLLLDHDVLGRHARKKATRPRAAGKLARRK